MNVTFKVEKWSGGTLTFSLLFKVSNWLAQTNQKNAKKLLTAFIVTSSYILWMLIKLKLLPVPYIM